VNELNRIVRTLVWGMLASCVVWLLRRWLSPAMTGAPARGQAYPVAIPIALYRDPSCGIHVSPEISVKLEQAGRMKHFCSAECRDQYVRSERHAASA
jgi:hypothetical protein